MVDNFDVIEKQPVIKPKVESPAEQIRFDITEFESLDSTNAHAKRLLEKSDVEEGTVIFSYHQTKGYSRYGREWVAKKGNFHSSIVMKPKTDIRQLAQLSFVVCLAVGRAVKALFPDDKEAVQYKWPNDILVNQKKVAGILLESSIMTSQTRADWVLVGIGVNTVSSPDIPTNFPATSLIDEDADPTTEKKLLKVVLEHLNILYLHWQKEGFARIRQEWLESVAFRDQIINVNTHNSSYSGIFQDMTEDGEIILELDNGRKRLISTGELFFASDHSRQ